MASINDLKKNSINNTPVIEDDSVSIDMTSDTGIQNSITHNETVYNNRPKGKTIVNAPNTITRADGTKVNLPPKRTTLTNNRVAFDLTQLPKEENKEEVHKSIEDDILTGKNPILYDYIKEKTQEAEKWVQEKEDEKKLKEAESTNNDDEELTIDITKPVEKEEEKDSISFKDYETEESNDENETYNIVDDILDEVEDNTNTIEYDTGEDMSDINNKELLDEEITNVDNNDLNDSETENIVEDEIAVDNINDNTVDDSSEEVNVDEMTDTTSVEEPVEKEDTFITSEGIEFQDTKGIEQENIPIEADDEPAKNTDDELDESTKYIIAEACKVLKPAAKKLDLSSFTVVKKPGNTNRFFKQKEINVAKWVLRNKRVCIHMKASQGSELEELRTLMTEADVASDFIRMYRIIYDHIVSPKPKSFEAWCKTTYTDDLDDYFFCFFIANYKGSNYIPYDCTNKDCKPGTFLSDNIPIMNMVKFGSDKDKEEFNNIYRSEIFDINKDGLYATERIPFSDEIAISFKENTLYSYVEAQSIRNNDRFIERYATTIALVPNIDDIFSIDYENESLNPVEYKTYPDSNSKTYISKIQKYDSVLKRLNPDEFATLTTFVNTFNSEKKKAINIKYIRPAYDCPHCGTKIAEADTTGQSLVFFRYQLAQMVNISTK